MKIPFIYFAALAIAILLSGNAYSQYSYTLHAGPSIPLSDFGDDDTDDEDAGGAGLGFCVGGNYSSRLNEKGLSYYLGADFIINGLKSSVRDDFEHALGSRADIRFYKFINVPVTAGLIYSFKADDQITLFGNAGMGPDFLKITKMTVELGGDKSEITFKTSTNFAYTIGGGMVVDDRIILTANYNGLGKHAPEGQVINSVMITRLANQSVKVSLLTVTLGIKF